ncbi:alkaline phosphatase [Flavobacterium granuli]|uniref:Alkaline phosphatase n=1 Tax=Flavobacterium granuli TaxID=280093 RepID=A0A1M5J5F1_9FLAO|nr:alkaline phosphatase [Flavobacterium granuli]PRZ28243.1 alkaline phosphatase [Flavobacterium granuli]SHG35741.1 alkaline phosphatase [Flavobacterium granuli]
MLKSYKINFFLFLFLLASISVSSQNSKNYKIHSHNDYEQDVPFWNATSNKLQSIEADIFFKNNTLYVTHSENDIIENRTIESLYLIPLTQSKQLHLGTSYPLQLLIDIKSEAYSTLNALIKSLKKYPSIINDPSISIVISGNRPKVTDYKNFPAYIKFDYQEDIKNPISKDAWSKVAIVSYDFKNFSTWNGKGRLTNDDYTKIKSIVNQVHALGKPVRFWGVHDSKTTWKTFVDLGIDFINTDQPYQCAQYLNSLSKRTYTNTIFSEVYTPSFVSDQKDTAIDNIILLIGDGNGLSQISSAVLANNGKLTLTQLRSIGFLKTQSADDFITDSAAAGTALATGVKTHNRAIGVDENDRELENLAEILYKKNYATGCITTDDITGATPAAFYAHQVDRAMTSEIAGDLLKSNLNLMIGGEKRDFGTSLENTNYSVLSSLEEIKNTKEEKVLYFLSDKGVSSVLSGRGNQLAEATASGLTYLKSKNKPFFLMVEGAQIDSYGHQNNVPGIISEGVDFDRAITEAVKFADQNPRTLVIVTADHETSGFSISQGDAAKHEIEGDFITDDHTGTMVPLFAYGPQSNKFTGVYENNELFYKILEVLKIKK